MALFELEADGKRYQVEAPDMAAAIEALGMHAGQSETPSKGGMFSDIIPEIKKAAGNAVDAMGRVTDRGKQGPLEGLATTGRAAMAVPELALSPLTGAARSLIGHPMAAAEHAVGSIIAPDIAAKDDPQAMYETAKGDVDTAMSALATRGVRVPVPVALAPAGPGQEVVNAASRLSDVTGAPIEVPRAIASDRMAVQRAGQAIRNLPIVGDRIPQATERLVEGLSEVTRNVADQYGSGSGPNVSNRIGRTIQESAEAETRAATEAARRSDEALQAAWQRDTNAAHQGVVAGEAQSLEQARATVGDMSPQDMGATLAQRLRTDERAARARKDQLYDEAGRADASVRLNEVENARAYVVEGLENAGVVIDPLLTPAANRMLDEVQRIAQVNIPNRAQLARPVEAGTERVGVTVQGIEQARKRLVSLRSAANNDADRRAARMVMDRFDDWQSHAFENALISGDDRALDLFRQARSANTEWRNRFFNDQDDAGGIINRIVTGEVTPQEVANYVIGAGQVGAKGVSSRLLTRIAEATGDNPEAMQAIRGGIWNRLTQATEGADPKASARVIRDVVEFLNGSGRDVAERLFTPEQRRLMSAYADTLRRGDDARQLIGEVSAATRPGEMSVAAGPLKQLADAVIGKGGKSDEALFRTIDSYAKSGNRADVGTLAKLIQAIPQQDRTDLAGAIIRNLGVSPRTGQFSPDVFVSQWKTYTPQAKAILFGNAGPQRVALDDIAVISDRLKQVGQKFGNPSGTAQNVNFAAMGGGLVAAPLTTLATAVGSYGLARILAAPSGAASAAKWSKAYAALRAMPTPQAIGLFQMSSRNLANTAQALGIKTTVDDLMRALQAPQQPEQDRTTQPVQVTR